MNLLKSPLIFSTLLLLLASCGSTYVRYSNLHHVQNYKVELHLTKEERRERSHPAPGQVLSDTTLSMTLGTDSHPDLSDTTVYFLEDGKVIWYKNSYFIKKAVSVKKYRRYVNQDIRL